MNGTSGVIERKALIFNVQKYNVYDGPGTVSYTHLDVYKRQPWAWSKLSACCI